MASESCEQIKTALIKWYGANKRALPWRMTRDPYRIWVSEVMLQQTQVKTVIPYYHRFLERFPDIHSLAASKLQPVLKSWEGLGYYGRARNLHKAAREVVIHHDGKIPDNAKELIKLPGVGDYISSAVLSIAFGRPHAVVDGNVKRVLARLYRVESPVNKPSSHNVYKKLSHDLMDMDNPGTYNQALMELGALVCSPRTPDCRKCPLPSHCLALANQVVGDYPRREKTKQVPHYATVAGVVIRKDKVLITRRKSDGLLGGLWEFPGGRTAPNESLETACIRSLKETVNLNIEILSHVTRVKHAYTHFKITVDVYICRSRSGRVRLSGPIDYRWVRLSDIEAYPFPKSNHKFIPALRKALDTLSVADKC